MGGFTMSIRKNNYDHRIDVYFPNGVVCTMAGLCAHDVCPFYVSKPNLMNTCSKDGKEILWCDGPQAHCKEADEAFNLLENETKHN